MNDSPQIGEAPIGAIVFRWLRAGAIDPEGGFAWPTGNGSPGSWVRGSWLTSSGVPGYQWGGLPYEIDQELWTLELDEIVEATPFSVPLDLGELGDLVEDLHYRELRLVARRGRLLGRVTAWTPHLGEEFGAECALQARGQVLQTLEDAERMIESAGSLGRPPVPIQQSDRLRSATGHAPYDQADLALVNAESLSRIWRETTDTARSGKVYPAAAFASGAALCRAATARVHARSLPSSSSRRAHDVAFHAYLDERRRQARLLRKRLRLDEAIREAARAA